MKFKIVFIIALSTLINISLYAQDDEEVEKTFKKENLFTGGSVSLGFGNNQTSLGLSPHFGYSLNRFVDVALSVNANYVSQRDVQFLDDRVRQTTIGPGAFLRLYPVKFLFAHAQYEHNFIKQTYKYPSGNNLPNESFNVQSNSFLVGGGYASGRERDNNTFYYISVLWDVANAKYSPYKDNLNRAVPVIRAGFNIGLFGNKN